MQTYQVNIAERAYPIYIGQQLLTDSQLLCTHIAHDQVMIVTNDTIAPLYLDPVKTSLANKQCDVTILPDGEAHKNLTTLNQIFDQLLQAKHHRSTTLIALGGGVIGDMTGFAASCYQRGVAFIQIPTTLLAQVDASVGGKTAVNHALGKNMIGAFYQPQAVIIDTTTLDTLPAREFHAGLAEVIKHGLIRDKDFFCWLETNLDQVLAKEQQALEYVIQRCCQIKAQVVATDEREQGVRAHLNFGHTFAHCFEQALGYGTWLHGEAVATGMVIACELSCLLGHITKAEVARVVALLQRCELPTTGPDSLGVAQCIDLMKLDKKVINGQCRFVLLQEVGAAYINDQVPASLLQQVLAESLDS